MNKCDLRTKSRSTRLEYTSDLLSNESQVQAEKKMHDVERIIRDNTNPNFGGGCCDDDDEDIDWDDDTDEFYPGCDDE